MKTIKCHCIVTVEFKLCSRLVLHAEMGRAEQPKTKLQQVDWNCVLETAGDGTLLQCTASAAAWNSTKQLHRDVGREHLTLFFWEPTCPAAGNVEHAGGVCVACPANSKATQHSSAAHVSWYHHCPFDLCCQRSYSIKSQANSSVSRSSGLHIGQWCIGNAWCYCGSKYCCRKTPRLTKVVVYTLCSEKKHPLTFSFISPWLMCRFKQKLQWIYPRNGGFWKCRN